MDSVTLTWLGQSGFVLSGCGAEIACDLYLSDYCQQKSKLDHTRLITIPVQPQNLSTITHYLITHGHIDHFDPYTVDPVLSASSGMKAYCPPACKTIVDEFFSGRENTFTYTDSFKTYELADGVRMIAIPAAHEDLEKDESGEYIAYSYIVLFEKTQQAVFFAGDTIPYEGQDQYIRDHVPAGYALTMVLPVNGRDKRRADLGFKGNLTLEEAIRLYQLCHADLLVPCHYGMFALNDITETMNDDIFLQANCRAVIPQVSEAFACAVKP